MSNKTNVLNWTTLRNDLRKQFGNEFAYYNDLNKTNRRIKIYHIKKPSLARLQWDKTMPKFVETTIVPYMTKIWDYLNANYPSLDKQKYVGCQIVLKLNK